VKNELLRFQFTEGELAADLLAVRPGRGVYCHLTLACLFHRRSVQILRGRVAGQAGVPEPGPIRHGMFAVIGKALVEQKEATKERRASSLVLTRCKRIQVLLDEAAKEPDGRQKKSIRL
jgi:hypothetical protein